MTVRIRDVGKRWQAITSLAAAAVAMSTAAFRPPPVGEASAYLALGGFLAAVASGLTYVVMTRSSSARHVTAWAIAAAACAVLAMGSHYVYESLWDSYVASYFDRQVIIGDEYTPEGRRWVELHGGTDSSGLLFDASGVAERIWTAASIGKVRRNMRLTYYMTFPLVAVAILATVQAVHIATRPKTKRRKSPARPSASAGSA